MHNTGNPLGSKDILDLYDNSENIDYFANSQLDEHPDRFGTKRLTLAGLIKRSMALRNEINDFSGALTFKPEWSDVPMNVSEGVGGEGGALNLQAEALGNRSEINKITSRETLRRSLALDALTLVEGSFEQGGVLNTVTDVLLEEKTGKVYSWSGSFPVIVPNGSTPNNTDQSHTEKWVSRETPELRSYVLNTTTVTFKNEGGNTAIENMIAGRIDDSAGFITHVLGNIYSTGATSWRVIDGNRGYPTPNGYKLIPLNGVWFQDYDVDNTGSIPCSALLNTIIADFKVYNITPTILLGHGDLFFNSTVEYVNGVKIRGEGRRGTYKYAANNDEGGTLIIVEDGVTAFQVTERWSQYPEISGITFRAKTNGSSNYGQPANFSENTNGIDLMYTIDGIFKELAFESMNFGIFNRPTNGQECLRPQISSIIGQDCNYLIRLLDGSADVHISDIPIALHCNYMVFADSTDGLHLSDIRFFQSYNTPVTFQKCQFVNGANIVLFECANTQMVIDDCDTVNISALTLSRAGWYSTLTPKPKVLALNVVNSRQVKLQGVIERPSGKAINIDTSDTITIDMDVKDPWNTNGGPSATTIFTSKRVHLAGNHKVRGNVTHNIEVDIPSRYEVFSKVVSDSFDKNLRFIETNALKFEGTIASGIQVVQSGTSAPLIQKKIKVPAGKLLALGHIRYDNTNGLRPRIGSNFFLTIPNTDEGKEDSSQYILLDNKLGTETVNYDLVVSLYNNTGTAINTGLDTITCYLKLLD